MLHYPRYPHNPSIISFLTPHSSLLPIKKFQKIQLFFSPLSHPHPHPPPLHSTLHSSAPNPQPLIQRKARPITITHRIPLLIQVLAIPTPVMLLRTLGALTRRCSSSQMRSSYLAMSLVCRQSWHCQKTARGTGSRGSSLLVSADIFFYSFIEVGMLVEVGLDCQKEIGLG